MYLLLPTAILFLLPVKEYQYHRQWLVKIIWKHFMTINIITSEKKPHLKRTFLNQPPFIFISGNVITNNFISIKYLLVLLVSHFNFYRISWLYCISFFSIGVRLLKNEPSCCFLKIFNDFNFILGVGIVEIEKCVVLKSHINQFFPSAAI